MTRSVRGAFAAWRLGRAARQYATRLGPRLRADYGAAETYTPAQVAAAADRLGLPSRHRAIGHAAFLSAADFATVADPARYAPLRALFERHRPPISAGGFEPAAENRYALSGGGAGGAIS